MKLPRLDGKPVDLFATRTRLLAAVASASLTLVWIVTTLLPSHAEPFTDWRQGALAVLFSLGIAAPLLRSRTERPIIALLSAPALLAVLGFCHAAPGAGLLWVVILLWASVVFLGAQAAAQQLRQDVPDMLAGVGTVLAVIGLWQVFFRHAAFAVGPLAQRNLFADAVTLGVVGLAFSPMTGRLRWIVLALMSLAVAASGSTAAVLYAVWLVAFGFWHNNAKLKLSGAAMLASIAGWHAVAHWTHHATHVPGVSIILTLWKSALLEILRHPLGIGVGHVAEFYFQTAAALPDTSRYAALHMQVFNNAHNIFLQVALTSGLPGILALGVLIAAFFARALKSEHAFATAALGVLWLHSLVEYPLWQPGFLALFAVFYGLSSGPSKAACKNMGSLPLLLMGYAAVMVVGLAGYALQMRDIQAAFKPAASELADAQNTAALQAWSKSHTPTANMLASANALALARKKPLLIVEPETWADSRRILDLAVAQYPTGSLPLERAVAWALTQSAPPAQIQAMARQAIQANPDGSNELLPVIRRWAPRIPALAPILRAESVR